MSNVALAENLSNLIEKLPTPLFLDIDENIEYMGLKRTKTMLNINSLKQVQSFRASKPIMPTMSITFNIPCSHRLFGNDFIRRAVKSVFPSLLERIYVEAYNKIIEALDSFDNDTPFMYLYRHGLFNPSLVTSIDEVISELESWNVDTEVQSEGFEEEIAHLMAMAYPMTDESEIAGEVKVLDHILSDEYHSANTLYAMKKKDGRIPENLSDSTNSKVKEYITRKTAEADMAHLYKLVNEHKVSLIYDPSWVDSLIEYADPSIYLEFEEFEDSIRYECTKESTRDDVISLIDGAVDEYANHIADGLIEVIAIGIIQDLLMAQFEYNNDQLSNFIFNLCDGIYDIVKDAGELIYE